MQKHVLLLFTVFFYTSCTLTIDIELEKSVSPSVLSAVSGRLFHISSNKSFIFFAQQEAVLIINRSDPNYYYVLKDGVEHDNIFSFRLEGSGPDNETYIAVLFHQTALAKISISVQGNRERSINAVQATKNADGEIQILEGIQIRSPGMYMLQELSPIIMLPNYTENIFVTDVVTDIEALPNQNAIITQNTLGNDPVVHNLNFETNITDTMVIYNFLDPTPDPVTGQPSIRLWGAVIDMKNFRLQVLQSGSVSPDPTLDELHTFSEQLRATTVWNYRFSNFLE